MEALIEITELTVVVGLCSFLYAMLTARIEKFLDKCCLSIALKLWKWRNP